MRDAEHTGSRPPGVRSSIASRLFRSYLVCALLPLLLVGVLLINIGISAQRENVYTQQRTLATWTARNIALYIGDLVREFSTYETVVRPSATSIDDWRAEALQLAERVYPNLVEFEVLDLKGREQLRINLLQAVPASELRDHGAELQVQAAIVRDQMHFTPLESDRGESLFLATLPLHNDAGTVIGALRSIVRGAPVVEELRASTLGTKSSAYLINTASGENCVARWPPELHTTRRSGSTARDARQRSRIQRRARRCGGWRGEPGDAAQQRVGRLVGGGRAASELCVR